MELHPSLTISQQLQGFAETAAAVLQFLNGHIQMGAWMITRRQAEDWVILKVDRVHPEVAEQSTLVWSESFCSRMVRGEGPSVTADSRQVPAYANAPIRARLSDPIVAYVGLPITGTDGQLFGTLCGISPDVQDGLEQHEPLLRLIGQMLSTILARELEAADAKRQIEKSRADANRDTLTQLYNRRGLLELIASEEYRCHTYGNSCYVFSVDLNGLKKVNDSLGHTAGDALIRRAAEAMSSVMRGTDIVARVGGDEFVIVAADCAPEVAIAIEQRLRGALRDADLSAAIGIARRESTSTIVQAIEIADAAMYIEKRGMKRPGVRASA